MYLLFDIGGTNLRVGVSEDGDTITKSKSLPTPQDFDTGIKTLKQMSDELIGSGKIEAAAGGAALVFNKDKSIPIATSHLHGWVHKPLKEILEDRFKVSVLLENDTAIFGLGEAVCGAGQGKNIVVYVTVSTGLGGVKIENQKIDGNALGFEPGHQIIVINGKDCHCGGKGHLEAYVAGWYLEKYYGKPAEDIKDQEVWDKVTKYLSVGLSNTIVHWSPDIVILGGAVMQSISLDTVKGYLRHDLTIFPKLPELVRAKLGDEGGLYGALAYLKSKF